MNYAGVVNAAANVGVLLCLLFLAVPLSRAARFAVDLVGGVGAICEALLAISAKLASLTANLAEAGVPNDLKTKLAELETRIQGSEMTVASAVENVTSLVQRASTRLQRARAREELDNGEEDGADLTPAQRDEALAALRLMPGVTAATATADEMRRGRGNSGWDRVRRNAATKRGKEA